MRLTDITFVMCDRHKICSVKAPAGKAPSGGPVLSVRFPINPTVLPLRKIPIDDAGRDNRQSSAVPVRSDSCVPVRPRLSAGQ